MTETRPPYITAAPPIPAHVVCCPWCGTELGDIAGLLTAGRRSVHPLTLGGVHLYYAAGWCVACGRQLRWSMKRQCVARIPQGEQLRLAL